MNLKFDDKQNPDNIPEQIKEYKELLDMGIITEEEYEKKKTELLNK
jgi:predicted Zn-dependent peptidase